MTHRTSTARAIDIAITVLLMLVSLALAIAFFFAGLLWGMDSTPHAIGFVLGVYGPITIAVIGVVVGIILMVRNVSAVAAPFGAIVLSVLLWWIGGTLVAS